MLVLAVAWASRPVLSGYPSGCVRRYLFPFVMTAELPTLFLFLFSALFSSSFLSWLVWTWRRCPIGLVAFFWVLFVF